MVLILVLSPELWPLTWHQAQGRAAAPSLVWRLCPRNQQRQVLPASSNTQPSQPLRLHAKVPAAAGRINRGQLALALGFSGTGTHIEFDEVGEARIRIGRGWEIIGQYGSINFGQLLGSLLTLDAINHKQSHRQHR